MAGKNGPVAPVQDSQTAYTTQVQARAAKWNQRVQACQVNPMQLAAAKQAEAIANYTAVLSNQGPNGWAAKLNATPVAFWKSQAQAGQQRYAMAKGAAKWGRWYQTTGMQLAQSMRNQAMADRANNVPGIQRAVNALQMAQNLGRKGNAAIS